MGQSISKLSLLFVKNFRATLIILVGILVVGGLAYTTLLEREGFPTIQFPLVSVNAVYTGADAQEVDTDITQPLVSELLELGDVRQITSNSSDNVAQIIIEFDEDVEATDGLSETREVLNEIGTLPETATITANEINQSRFNGLYDMLISIGGDSDQVASQANVIADALDDLETTTQTTVIANEVVRTNTAGDEQTVVERINRIGTVEFINDPERSGDMRAITSYEAISIGVTKPEDISVSELSDTVRAEIDNLVNDDELDSDLEILYVGDFAEIINDQIAALEANAISGLIIVLIVLSLLVNWRSSIIAAIFMPTVIAGTMLGLLLAGYTLNVISLFAIILVLGLFVDDAIVVIEAIDYAKQQGLKGFAAIRSAIKTIGIADVSGTLTTVLVFLPLAAISGVLGEFIRLIPITVIIALSISLVVALTVIPVLSHWSIPDQHTKRNRITAFLDAINDRINRLTGQLSERYANSLKHNLKRPAIVSLAIISSLVAVAIGAGAAGQLKFNVFPTAKDSNDLQISAEFPDNTDIADADALLDELETQLVDDYEQYIEYYYHNESDQQLGRIVVQLTPYQQRDITSMTIAAELAAEFEDIDTAEISVTQGNVGPSSSEFQFAAQIIAEDAEVLEALGNDIIEFMEFDLELPREELEFVEIDLQFIEETRRIDNVRQAQIRAKLDGEPDNNDIFNIRDEIVAEFDEDVLQTYGVDSEDLTFDLGLESDFLESFNSAAIALIISLIVMYCLLVLQFNSFSQPLLIFVAIPFSFVLLFPGLVSAEYGFSFLVQIGLAGLIGIVVNNSVMLLDYANQAKAQGFAIAESVAEAIRIRLRPLVATSATTILGLLPLAASDPFWQPLALTIILGLISSTTLVILAFPAYYMVLEKGRELVAKLFD